MMRLLPLLLLLSSLIYAEDQPSLQRGARTFMNYCSGCHSLKYMRYNRMAQDLGLITFEGHVDKNLLTNNLIFTQSAIEDPIQISMPMADARQWFGIAPPDLSLTARARGPVWLFSYLKSFYEDKHRPFGSNNLIFKDVAMPDVLAPLRGQVRVDKQSHLVLVQPGSLSPRAFDQLLTDLVTFLDYVGEPNRETRTHAGIFVLVFLAVLLGFVYALKRWYWKRID